MPDLPLAAFLVSLGLSWLLTALLIRWAPRLGLIDQPAARKVHSQPTPRGGGLAIYVAVAAGSCCLGTAGFNSLLPLLGSGLLIVLLGLADDWRPLPWQLRLGVQAAVGAALVIGWHAYLGWLWGGAAILWIVALTNAFNMLDNMDALSPGVATIAALFLGLAAGSRGGPTWDWPSAAPYLPLVAACLGFLWFNRPPARIFMGDAGSTFLGFFLGVGSLGFAAPEPATWHTWLVPICILAVPLYDMTSVIALRVWQGRSPFHADRQHLSHRLTDLGLSRPAAVNGILLFGVASGLTGLAVSQTTPFPALLVVLGLGVWWLALAAVEYFRHFRREAD
jgi:UDP-GlcNAc:undecaprenyl-phosphate/decaprenyl-phosphate GlcNAc-1-phosphate transferase